jgi:hypothetical protein
MMNFIKDLLVPIVGLIILWIVQTKTAVEEKTLTVLVVVISIVVFLISYNHNEEALFLAGVILGIMVETGLRFGGQQYPWRDTSFFGMPSWLPLVWGFGFVIATRIGFFIQLIK